MGEGRVRKYKQNGMKYKSPRRMWAKARSGNVNRIVRNVRPQERGGRMQGQEIVTNCQNVSRQGEGGRRLGQGIVTEWYEM